MQTNDVGEVRYLDSHWYDRDGNDIEPSAITLTLTHPDGSTDTWNKAALTQGDTVADWFRAVVPDAVGLWRFDYVGTVDGNTVEQGGSFLVGDDASTSSAGPCEPWCSWDDVEACGTVDGDVSAQMREYAIDTASEILFNLTGRVYTGMCTTTRSLCLSCRSCYPVACSCEPVNGMDLGIAAPVWGVSEVIVDGVTLPASDYALHNRRWLVRTNGQSWPYRSSTASLLDPLSFRATWTFGRPIPLGGRRSAALFAHEIAKLCVGDKSCGLPQRVTSVTREGVTFTVLDSMKMVQEGRTGLMLVDLWLTADAKGRKSKPRLFAPAAPSGVRRIS